MRALLADFEVDDAAFSIARRFSDGGRRDGPPLTWGVEKWAELTDFAVDDSAFSVRYQFVMAAAGMHTLF